MGKLRKCGVLKCVLILLLAAPHKTVTVSPALCPTNKIAPHRVVASGRTFAAYHDLLFGPNTPHAGPHTQQTGPHTQQTGAHAQQTGAHAQQSGPHYQQNGPHYQQSGAHYQQNGPHYQQNGPHYQQSGAHYQQNGPHYQNGLHSQNTGPYIRPTGSYTQASQGSLVEDPQPDQADDCGDIEDYDENDLSFVNQRKRAGRTDNRFFFGGLFQAPQPHPTYKPPQVTSPTQAAPTRPQAPAHLSHRPPYWSGGLFSNNHYQPPLSQEPSDNLKPVHEAADISEVPQTYRPGLVGGPLNHVVGLSQARPTTTATPDQDRRRLEYLLHNRIHPTQSTIYTTRRPKPRKLTNDGSVIGSFLDLFF